MEIRVATGIDELAEVYELVHRVYVAEGYCPRRPDGKLQHYPHLDGIEETTVLIATEQGALIGTNSLTLDGPTGLHVDEDFVDEMRVIRSDCFTRSQQLAASWRIVTDPECRRRRAIVMALIGATWRLADKQAVDVLMCSFHPKHEQFYERVIGMRTVARGKCQAAGGAPAVLMTFDKAYDRRLDRWR